MKRGFKIILADPPWQFRSRAGGAWQSGAADKYPVMDVSGIAGLASDIDRLAADDCALFLWMTGAMLGEAMTVLAAWGFDYRTVAFTWVKMTKDQSKVRAGMGLWTRQAAEFVLLGVRGHPKRNRKDVLSVISAPVRGHSQKPAEVRGQIVRLLGPVKRVELFAREHAIGWSAWGHGVTGDMTLAEFAKKEGRADRL